MKIGDFVALVQVSPFNDRAAEIVRISEDGRLVVVEFPPNDKGEELELEYAVPFGEVLPCCHDS